MRERSGRGGWGGEKDLSGGLETVKILVSSLVFQIKKWNPIMR